MSIKTVQEEIEVMAKVDDETTVSSLIYSGQAANIANKTAWNTLAILFASEKVDSMESLAELLKENIPEGVEPTTNKNGDITFRSWSATKNLWKYATIVVKAVNNYSLAEVFPADKPIPTLAEVKKLAYGEKTGSSKTEAEKFEIMLTSLLSVYGKIEGEKDREKCLALVKDSFDL